MAPRNSARPKEGRKVLNAGEVSKKGRGLIKSREIWLQAENRELKRMEINNWKEKANDTRTLENKLKKI